MLRNVIIPLTYRSPVLFSKVYALIMNSNMESHDLERGLNDIEIIMNDIEIIFRKKLSFLIADISFNILSLFYCYRRQFKMITIFAQELILHVYS